MMTTPSPPSSLTDAVPPRHDEPEEVDEVAGRANGEAEVFPPHVRRVTPDLEARELSLVSREEILLAHSDAYGVDPPGEAGRLEAFDREMGRLPAERKAALHKGYTAKQARAFLRLEGGDPGRAADRMARYWESRLKALGEEVFDSTRPKQTDEDFIRMYRLALDAKGDPEVDGETRDWARLYSSTYEDTKVKQLEAVLDGIPAYSKARALRADVLLSRECMLDFLRIEEYDARRAARRVVKYWAFQFEMIDNGDDFCSTTAESLLEEYPAELLAALARRIPGTDASGRGILSITSSNFGKHVSIKGTLKVLWYVLHSMYEDESCRANGIVVLANQKGTGPSMFNWEANIKSAQMVLESMPLSVKAMHECMPQMSWFLKALAPVNKWVMGRKFRLRYCIHAGSDEQILRELEQYGISSEQIPKELGGSLDLESASDAWLEDRRTKGL